MRRPRPAPMRCSNRNFAVSACTTRQSEIGEIGAGDQEYQADSGKQDVQRFAQLRPNDRVGERVDGDAPSFVRIGIVACNSRSDSVHFRSRLLDRYAGFEERHCSEPVEVPRHVLRLKCERQIDLSKRTIEHAALRKHADDDVRLAIELDGSPDDARVSTEL